MQDSNSSSGTTNADTNDRRRGNGQRRQTDRALPVAGYLYEEKTDVEDIIDPSDMGLNVL